MALNPLDNSNLEQLALKGLMSELLSGFVVSAHGKVQLCVIGVLVVLYTMPHYDVSHGTAVRGEQ